MIIFERCGVRKKENEKKWSWRRFKGKRVWRTCDRRRWTGSVQFHGIKRREACLKWSCVSDPQLRISIHPLCFPCTTEKMNASASAYIPQFQFLCTISKEDPFALKTYSMLEHLPNNTNTNTGNNDPNIFHLLSPNGFSPSPPVLISQPSFNICIMLSARVS